MARNKIIIKHYKDSGQINGGQENGTCTVTCQDLLSRINMLCPERNQAKTESYNHQLTSDCFLFRTYKSLESNLNMICFLVNKEGHQLLRNCRQWTPHVTHGTLNQCFSPGKAGKSKEKVKLLSLLNFRKIFPDEHPDPMKAQQFIIRFY